MKQKQKVLILGAGVAGLSAAWRLVEEGYDVEIFEREAVVGGLSRTTEYKGFLFDFSAHRFNSDNPDIVKRFKYLAGDHLLRVDKKSLIYNWGKYLQYPPKAQEVLFAMPPLLALRSGFEFTYATIKSMVIKPKNRSFSDWTRSRFGKTLSKHLNEKYAEKLWKRKANTLSGDWATQRIGSFRLKDFLVALFTKGSNNVYKQSDPDSDWFYYCDNGIGQFPLSMAREVQKKGGTIRTKTIVNRIEKTSDGYTVSYLENGTIKKATGDLVISTLPLDILIRSIANPVPAKVKKTIQSLQYLAVIIVNILVNKPKVTDVSWIYYPDRDMICNYIMEFKNWSRNMAPKDKTSISVNITSMIGDDIWKMKDKDLIKRSITDLEKVDMLHRKDVIDGFVQRLPYAYPLYDLDYKKNMQVIQEYLSKFPGFYTVGRTGNFQYINSDRAMEDGIATAERIIESTQ